MGSKSGYCKLHLAIEQLVDAHVIPRAIFPGAKGQEEPPPRTYEGTKNVRRRTTRIGWYDKNLCCRAAEDIFAPWDDYAIKRLRSKPSETDWVRDAAGRIVLEEGAPLAFLMRNLDYHKFKMFYVSLLWRAAASDRQEFQGLSIKSVEDKLRNMILDDKSGSAEDFSVVLNRFSEETPKTKILFHPFVEEIEGVTFATFTFGGFVSRIKIDDTPTPPELREFQLTPEQDLIVVQTNFNGSQIHQLALEMIAGFEAA